MMENEQGKEAGQGLYILAGFGALVTVLVMILEMLLTLLPGGGIEGVGAMTVSDWFSLFRESAFMGMRNLGFMNILSIVFTIPVYVALYSIHRQGSRSFAALAAVLYFVGAAIYLAGNVAFPMLSLSQSYAAAANEAERTMILAAGQALLARGESHTAGTFLGFLFVGTAGILISIVILRSRIFARFAAIAGIIGFALLLAYDVIASFLPALFWVSVFVVLIGGPLSLLWNVCVGAKFLKQGLNRGAKR